MVKRQKKAYRVALIAEFPSGLEDEVINGVLDYVDHSPHWQFVAHGHRPFKRFDEIKLEAIDGIIGFFINREWADTVVKAGVAAVDTGADFAALPIPRIANDDVFAGRIGAEHLLERGLPNFGFLTCSGKWFRDQRLAGFQHAMEKAGRSCHILKLVEGDDQYWDMIHSWLEALPKPIGIMCVADNLAADLVNAATDLGLHVPDDVAVIGVDNDRWASAVAAKPLSSVEMDMRRIGYKAAKLLERLMAGDSPPPPQYIPPLGVVVRKSSEIQLTLDSVVNKALQFIRKHACEDIHIDDVVHAVYASRSSLLKRMKKETGRTLHDTICRARIEKAKELLIQSDAPMDKIARQCGFRQQPRLNEQFKRLTGMTPGEFRLIHRR